jgi:hypothetical protein
MESERNPQHILASNQNTEFIVGRKIQDVKTTTLLTYLNKHGGDPQDSRI